MMPRTVLSINSFTAVDLFFSTAVSIPFLDEKTEAGVLSNLLQITKLIKVTTCVSTTEL
jgi:hypothetical protein